MNLRLFATVCCMALTTGLLQGCAGTPTTADQPADPTLEVGNLPQKLMSGAQRSDLKSLAMGAARSKGWTIVDSDSDRLILRRPAESRDLPPSTTVPPGSSLEVTSYFIEQPGGVNVATKAELVSPYPGTAQPLRTDYTDYFRDTLNQSLDRLAANWMQNRNRLARAVPPASGWKSAWEESHPEENAEDGAQNAPPPSAPAATTASTQDSNAAPAAPTTAAALPPRSYDAPRTTPAPEPRRTPSGAAPVVDATAVLASGRTPSSPDYSYEPRQNDMMTLPPSGRSPSRVTMTASAEQFARQHGCEIDGGSQLIESRQDGEVHKVSCVGRDSVLVKCQSGVCKSLL
ncbi:hypothetical protein ThidrDRAFT_2556 [Thiorhodococcus drewsii AZ1]|uniref:PASTA domain-containing protein n=2 Tax=Thiorhodococcus drewsii TaxID=210408 RepID=G2E2P3_9GAMM|nr:hypothetical protein ThidrDRAFT_2556 [Thiorhodococcus drewsii AZ1]